MPDFTAAKRAATLKLSIYNAVSLKGVNIQVLVVQEADYGLIKGPVVARSMEVGECIVEDGGTMVDSEEEEIHNLIFSRGSFQMSQC